MQSNNLLSALVSHIQVYFNNFKATSQFTSPKNLILTYGRTIPFEVCMVNKNWQNGGLENLFVERKHKNENRSILSLMQITFANIAFLLYVYSIIVAKWKKEQ